MRPVSEVVNGSTKVSAGRPEEKVLDVMEQSVAIRQMCLKEDLDCLDSIRPSGF